MAYPVLVPDHVIRDQNWVRHLRFRSGLVLALLLTRPKSPMAYPVLVPDHVIRDQNSAAIF